MKSRSQELVEKSVSAMISAIEIYNKPDFKYREETFSILAINAWELLLKAKWLKDNQNIIRSLYVVEKKNRPNGEPYKYPKTKLTSCGNPYTHGIDYLSKKLADKNVLDAAAHKNIEALCEIRNCSVHFYNKSTIFAIRLQEIGSASVKNFVRASQIWFDTDLSQYNFYLMPLAFFKLSAEASPVLLNKEEKNLASYISGLEAANDPNADFAVSVNIELKFSKSKAGDALQVQLTNDPNAHKLQLVEDQLKDKYPLNYEALTQECRSRYTDFIINNKYHSLRNPLKSDRKYCHIKRLDSDNPRSAKQEWFSRAIFTVLDTAYTRKK